VVPEVAAAETLDGNEGSVGDDVGDDVGNDVGDDVGDCEMEEEEEAVSALAVNILECVSMIGVSSERSWYRLC